MALAPADRTRLAKFLGLLGSSHPNERDAVGLAAHRFVQAKGLTWARVLEQRRAAYAPSAAPSSSWPKDPGAVDLRTPGQRLDLRMAWEKGFIADLAQRPVQRFSRKQNRAAGSRAG